MSILFEMGIEYVHNGISAVRNCAGFWFSFFDSKCEICVESLPPNSGELLQFASKSMRCGARAHIHRQLCLYLL